MTDNYEDKRYIISCLQGTWESKQDGFSFTIDSEDLIIANRKESIIGLKWQPGLWKWSIALTPFGIIVGIINDNISSDYFELIKLEGQNPIDLNKCEKFSLTKML